MVPISGVKTRIWYSTRERTSRLALQDRVASLGGVAGVRAALREVEARRARRNFARPGNATKALVTVALVAGPGTIEMDQSAIRNLLLFSTAFAALGAVLFGPPTGRLEPNRTLVVVLVAWLVAIGLAAAALAPWMLLVAGPSWAWRSAQPGS